MKKKLYGIQTLLCVQKSHNDTFVQETRHPEAVELTTSIEQQGKK